MYSLTALTIGRIVLELFVVSGISLALICLVWRVRQTIEKAPPSEDWTSRLLFGHTDPNRKDTEEIPNTRPTTPLRTYRGGCESCAGGTDGSGTCNACGTVCYGYGYDNSDSDPYP